MGRYNVDEIKGTGGDISSPFSLDAWPTTFDKPVVGIDLNGVIVQNEITQNTNDMNVFPRVLEAIKRIRLNGHKLVVLSDQPRISEGLILSEDVDRSFQALMKIFGEAGIQSIDGFLYNTTSNKNDFFAKPNTGMVERAEKEFLRGARLKNGWYVGDSFVDLKFADRIGAKPVLIKTGNYQEALDKLEKHTYNKLKRKTAVYESLLDFANDL